MRSSRIIILVLGLVALLTVSASAFAKSSATSTTFTQTGDGFISTAAGKYDFSIDGTYLNVAGTLNGAGTVSGGNLTDTTLTFTSDTNAFSDILLNATGTYSTAGGSFGASFTDGTTVIELTGASTPYFDDGIGDTAYGLSNVSATTVNPVPEVSSILSFGCVLGLAGLFALANKRRSAMMDA